jgi:hypothetical protein
MTKLGAACLFTILPLVSSTTFATRPSARLLSCRSVISTPVHRLGVVGAANGIRRFYGKESYY